MSFYQSNVVPVAVFVDGKRVVADIIDLNIKEGWVEIEDPSIFEQAPHEEGEVGDDLLQNSVSLPTKKLYGDVNVRVMFDKS